LHLKGSLLVSTLLLESVLFVGGTAGASRSSTQRCRLARLQQLIVLAFVSLAAAAAAARPRAMAGSVTAAMPIMLALFGMPVLVSTSFSTSVMPPLWFAVAPVTA